MRVHIHSQCLTMYTHIHTLAHCSFCCLWTGDFGFWFSSIRLAAAAPSRQTFKYAFELQ